MARPDTLLWWRGPDVFVKVLELDDNDGHVVCALVGVNAVLNKALGHAVNPIRFRMLLLPILNELDNLFVFNNNKNNTLGQTQKDKTTKTS